MTIDTMIGIDLAKIVFQLHGASMTGEVKFRKKLSRLQFHRFIDEHPAAIIVMEACGSAHYWAREIAKHGHEVKLIAPQYVRPFVKRQKNDAADAEAIVIAAQQPEMRFVVVKSEAQQALAQLRCSAWQTNVGKGGVRTSTTRMGEMIEQIWVR